MTQDNKAGARGEVGHWVPSPMLPPLGTKGRCDPPSPDGAKFRAKCQLLHCSTHLHMLETGGTHSAATDRTRNRKHDTNTHYEHALTSNSPVQLQTRRLQSFECFVPRVSLLLLFSQSAENVLIHDALKVKTEVKRGCVHFQSWPFPAGSLHPAHPHRSVQLVCA